jgi:hypothetical protein
MFPRATVEAWTGWNVQCCHDHLKDLISTNVVMLESLLRDVATTRKTGPVVGHLGSESDATRNNPYDEIQLVIKMKEESLDSNDFGRPLICPRLFERSFAIWSWLLLLDTRAIQWVPQLSTCQSRCSYFKPPRSEHQGRRRSKAEGRYCF